MFVRRGATRPPEIVRRDPIVLSDLGDSSGLNDLSALRDLKC